jgi:hypothetical protein
MEKDPDVALGLICLVSNIKKEVCGVLDSFFSFLKKFDGKKNTKYVNFNVEPKVKKFSLSVFFHFS